MVCAWENRSVKNALAKRPMKHLLLLVREHALALGYLQNLVHSPFFPGAEPFPPGYPARKRSLRNDPCCPRLGDHPTSAVFIGSLFCYPRLAKKHEPQYPESPPFISAAFQLIWLYVSHHLLIFALLSQPPIGLSLVVGSRVFIRQKGESRC